MPSMEETFAAAASAVGETSTVGAMLGVIVSIVEVGTAVGGTLAGIGVAVDSITGTGVQAGGGNMMAMNFFIGKYYMSHLHLRQVQVLRGAFAATKQSQGFQVILLIKMYLPRGDCFAEYARNDML